jgi:hypothetical protein
MQSRQESPPEEMPSGVTPVPGSKKIRAADFPFYF